MRIKDLLKTQILEGWKLKEGYIVSGWNKGFWVTDSFKKYKTDGGGKVTPVFFNDPKEILEWEIKPPKSK